MLSNTSTPNIKRTKVLNTYRVVKGHDHFNQIPLYQCVGVNNDYVGEWHTNEIIAHREETHLRLSNDLLLNNGSTAVFVCIDFWDRPQYDIEVNGKTFRVCCTELNGTYLHIMSSDLEEPISPLKQEYQPVPR